MVRRGTHQTVRRSGFTLLEVVLAVAATGMLLAAAVSLVVNLSSIWTNREQRTFFVDHVDGVTEFLQGCIDRAGMLESVAGETLAARPESEGADPAVEIDPNVPDTEPPPEASGGGEASVTGTDEPIMLKPLPGEENFGDPLITFTLADQPPLLVGGDTEIQLVECFMQITEDDGLCFLWSSNLQEELEDVDDLYRTQISPYVTRITYIYYDEAFESWEEEDELLESDGARGDYELPLFFKLFFSYEGETVERLFAMPIRSTQALIF